MEDKIKALKLKLEKINTIDLLGMISTRFLICGQNGTDIARQSDMSTKTKLKSPQRQLIYLAGLLMSTEDKSDGNRHNYSDEKWFECLERDIQDITFDYFKGFFDAGMQVDEGFVHQSLVSIEAFSSYFDMGVLRYPEQTIKLMRQLYGNFNNELQELSGLGLEDYLGFYYTVYNEVDKSIKAISEVEEEIEQFLKPLNQTPINIEEEYNKIVKYGRGEARRKLKTALDNINFISTKRVYEIFGDIKARILIDTFSLQRKQRDFLYYNNQNPFKQKPLCSIEENTKLFVVTPDFVLNAIFEHVTDVLEKNTNPFAEKYKKKKAEVVENLFCELLEKILGDKAIIHRNVCEERGTKEHDILVETNNYILIAEAKASKVREPLFNSQKSFIRIKDHFNSEAGIGGAYKQAIILKKFIEIHEEIELFEDKVKKFKITDIRKKKILPLVLTLNQFGDIAVNTSELLNKEDDQPFPWVCNWHDLDNIYEVLTYLKKGPNDFLDYIVWRIENHSRVKASDELDVFEAYFMNNISRDKKTILYFAPNGSNIVDKVYFEKHGIPYDFPINIGNTLQRKKIGRNDPCLCGSGKKYKKCCIGKGIYD